MYILNIFFKYFIYFFEYLYLKNVLVKLRCTQMSFGYALLKESVQKDCTYSIRKNALPEILVKSEHGNIFENRLNIHLGSLL